MLGSESGWQWISRDFCQIYLNHRDCVPRECAILRNNAAPLLVKLGLPQEHEGYLHGWV